MNTNSHYSTALSSQIVDASDQGTIDQDIVNQEPEPEDASAWPGVAPPAGWFLLTKEQPARTHDDSSVQVPTAGPELLPTMALQGRAGGPRP